MATVTRVLPWRRSAALVDDEVAALVATYRSIAPAGQRQRRDPGLRDGEGGARRPGPDLG